MQDPPHAPKPGGKTNGESELVAERRIPTNLRNILILEIVANGGASMTPSEINRELGLPKQTVHRLCNTLVREGFLVREPDGRRLRPGRRLRQIGAGVLHASRSHIARRQVLIEVAAKVEETVNFVVPRDDGMHYVDRVETDWPFRIQLPVGTDVPFHCTASGKVFLASLPVHRRRAFIRGLHLTAHTPNTLDDPDLLLEDTRRVAERGYAIDEEEFFEGMNAVAVPVTDGGDRYVASLAFHGPKSRLSIETAVSRVGVLFEGARKLGRAILA